MSQLPATAIKIRMEPTNPGQFFACCGLLELADRLWSGAEGWFEDQGRLFCLHPIQESADASAATLIRRIAACGLANSMTLAQLARRNELSSMPKREREEDPALETEKKKLDGLWREAPILLDDPFHLRLDWFLDEGAGGDTFKTWAGQQSVVDIARGMKAPLEAGDWHALAAQDWLFRTASSDDLPFNFDSALGGMGSDRDVGFSFDPLKRAGIRVQTRPLIEFAAFVGLQRFRPLRVKNENRYRFCVWFDPLVPEVAAAATSLLELGRSRTFEFRLLYRTKYLKSFLPANPL